MSPTLKRILLILGFLVIVILIGYGLYSVFIKKPSAGTTPPTGGGGQTTNGQFPSSTTRGTTGNGTGENGGGPLTGGGTTVGSGTNPPTFYQPPATVQITSDFSAFPSLSNGGNMRYYNQTDGKFYRIGPDGKPIAMSDQVFYNAQNVVWAKTQDKAVIEYPDGSKILYNFNTKQQVSFPKHWEDFSFSPDGNQLAAKSMGLSPDNRWLIVTKDDGTGTQAIEPLGTNGDKVTVDWSPSRQTLALSRTGAPQGGERQEVLFVGANHENFKSTVVEGIDFQPSWSPTGNRLLYSIDNASSDFKPDLWVVDAYGDTIGNNRRQLKLNTWAEKCTFAGSDDTLYCAVPNSLPEGAGMEPSLANSTADTLYKIDLRTGLKQTIPLDTSYTITNINYDKTSNKLFFTDPNKAGIYQVNI